ncbi:hypothetical protein B7463_g10446, partial [Scytalidium lignicola]
MRRATIGALQADFAASFRLGTPILLKYKPLLGMKLTPRSRYYSASQVAGGPLDGIKILDLSRVLAGPFCTQILADYGADVLKVEHPIGDDTRLWREEGEEKIWKPEETDMSLYFSTINRNKRSISLNLKHEKGKEILLQLVKKADIVVDNFIPGKLEELGVGYETLRQINPRIIHASISGYGAGGPYAKRAGYDVIAAAEGGLLHITGESDGPPTKPGVGIMDLCTGLYVHGAVLAALQAREKSGLGQKVDGSLFETTLSLLCNVGMSWLNLGREAKRWGTGHPSIVPYEAFETKDSYLVAGAVNNRQFQNICRLLGNDNLAKDPRFTSNGARVSNRKDLKVILDHLFSERTTEEWLAVFEGSGMPYGPINTLEKAFSHPQTAARDMILTVDQHSAASGQVRVLGVPVKFSETKPSVREGPPSLGQHTDEVLQENGFSKEAISDLRKEGVL